MNGVRRVSALLGAVGALTLMAACSSSGHGAATTATAPATATGAASAPATGSGTAAVATPAAPAGAGDWTTYHGDNSRTGYASTMPAVSGKPVVTHALKLDGAVYGSPIVIGGVTVVATENDTVYAFDSAYRQVWKKHLGTPSPAAERPCGNIDPLGITGTPVYSAATGLVYIAPEFSGHSPTHQLYALSLRTGATAFHRSLDLPGVDRAAMQQRGALSVSGHRVYVPFGGLAGDCGQYKGRVVGVGDRGTGATVSYTAETTREAGIWTPPGATIDSTGNLLVAEGNGESGVGDPYDYSDSVLELSPDLKRIGSFSPSTWPTDNDSDLDLGSQGPAVVGKFVFTDGKSGRAYVLHRAELGGIGGQVSQATVCKSFGGTAVRGSTVYVPCTDGIRAVDIDSTGRIHVRWHAASSVTGSPVIGGGRLWSLDTAAGVLHGLSTTTGAALDSVPVGSVTRFATPSLYGRDVIVPTTAGITVVRTS